ncbi:protein Lilipod [Tetranychus urticae]|uniref:protein Lilipod n=1 Tax=Tetranychus urticae TaxID=32264 RepID=UPI00077BFDBC|nr:protein Lilipod [Tetranychus urticae]
MYPPNQPYGPVSDPREQAFNDMIRENVIFLIILITLYGLSYLIISSYLKRQDEFYTDEEDELVFRISFWMCTFSLATSIGSTLLLPFSIIANEVLLLSPYNYYLQWLNDSLIKGLWNYVFIFSNISLFVLLPFAYFFPESEGFTNSRRGLTARVHETLVLLLLLSVLVCGLTYITCSLLGYNDLAFTTLLNMNNYLPLLYSCVSFLGVILLLLCTPIGIARLFTVLGELIMKPKFLRNILEEYEMVKLEEMHLNRKIKNLKDGNSSSMPTSPWSPVNRSKSVPSIPQLIDKEETKNDIFNKYNLQMPWTSPNRGEKTPIKCGNLTQLKEMEKTLEILETRLKELESQKRASAFRRSLGYPLAMLVLLVLTTFAAFLVMQNTLQLLVGVKALPITSAQTFVVGLTSLSKMGPFGALLEIILILYLWCASIVGLYSLPGIERLRPRLGGTSFTQCVTNCVLLIILSSALPVLARTVGITNFDLLGNFGRIKWLGNFYVVLFYNTVFALTTALSLTDKFTVSVRTELFRRLANIGWCWTWHRTRSFTLLNSHSQSKND